MFLQKKKKRGMFPLLYNLRWSRYYTIQMLFNLMKLIFTWKWLSSCVFAFFYLICHHYINIVALFYYLSLSNAHYFTIEHINSQLDAPIFFSIVKSSAIQGDGQKTNTNKEAAGHIFWCSHKPRHHDKFIFQVWTTPTITELNSRHVIAVSQPRDCTSLIWHLITTPATYIQRAVSPWSLELLSKVTKIFWPVGNEIHQKLLFNVIFSRVIYLKTKKAGE